MGGRSWIDWKVECVSSSFGRIRIQITQGSVLFGPSPQIPTPWQAFQDLPVGRIQPDQTGTNGTPWPTWHACPLLTLSRVFCPEHREHRTVSLAAALPGYSPRRGRLNCYKDPSYYQQVPQSQDSGSWYFPCFGSNSWQKAGWFFLVLTPGLWESHFFCRKAGVLWISSPNKM